jgi:hypothetical protein
MPNTSDAARRRGLLACAYQRCGRWHATTPRKEDTMVIGGGAILLILIILLLVLVF